MLLIGTLNIEQTVKMCCYKSIIAPLPLEVIMVSGSGNIQGHVIYLLDASGYTSCENGFIETDSQKRL